MTQAFIFLTKNDPPNGFPPRDVWNKENFQEMLEELPLLLNSPDSGQQWIYVKNRAENLYLSNIPLLKIKTDENCNRLTGKSERVCEDIYFLLL